jgi:hypothetical protein
MARKTPPSRLAKKPKTTRNNNEEGETPLEELSSRASMLRLLKPTRKDVPVSQLRGESNIQALLSQLLELPVSATIERGSEVSECLIRLSGATLAIRVTDGSAVTSGTHQVSFRSCDSEVSFLTQVELGENGCSTLAIPTTVEQVDCRGPDRIDLVADGMRVGLTFQAEGHAKNFPVLDLSHTGISIQIVDLAAMPKVGDVVWGSLLFRNRSLVHFEAEVRNLTPELRGTRVGLKVTAIDVQTSFTLDDVAEALAV